MDWASAYLYAQVHYCLCPTGPFGLEVSDNLERKMARKSNTVPSTPSPALRLRCGSFGGVLARVDGKPLVEGATDEVPTRRNLPV